MPDKTDGEGEPEHEHGDQPPMLRDVDPRHVCACASAPARNARAIRSSDISPIAAPSNPGTSPGNGVERGAEMRQPVHDP